MALRPKDRQRQGCLFWRSEAASSLPGRPASGWGHASMGGRHRLSKRRILWDATKTRAFAAMQAETVDVSEATQAKRTTFCQKKENIPPILPRQGALPASESPEQTRRRAAPRPPFHHSQVTTTHGGCGSGVGGEGLPEPRRGRCRGGIFFASAAISCRSEYVYYQPFSRRRRHRRMRACALSAFSRRRRRRRKRTCALSALRDGARAHGRFRRAGSAASVRAIRPRAAHTPAANIRGTGGRGPAPRGQG